MLGYLLLAQILLEAKEDRGLSPEEKKVKRDKRRFGDSWEVKPGFKGMSSHETRKMLHGRSQRKHRGQSTPEDKEWFAKKNDERPKPITKDSSKQAIAGRRRSIKSRLEKSKAEPKLKLPESLKLKR